ncbi:MAG TPA: M24 family metallopeptidase [Nitrososphaerales archaeon]|nr:M24 family metallopeptidase [Nitrososphaerales archaeon]
MGRFPESHLVYNNATLESGVFVKIDFGVKHKGYCSDIQRVYFIGGEGYQVNLKGPLELQSQLTMPQFLL